MAKSAFNTFVLQFQQIMFVTWTAMKTYFNGPYYSFLELNRNYELFGRVRKLTAEDGDIPPCLIGKTCVITGGSRGIGLEVVKALLAKGCHVITGSSATQQEIDKRHESIVAELGDNNKGLLEIFALDLSSMDSVMQFIDRVKACTPNINYLICNGGVMFVPFSLTADSFESHLAINYLSHCLLIWHLLPNLIESGKQCGHKSRIVCVSSGAHRPASIRLNDLQSQKLYSTYHAYAQSKLAQIMFTYSFNEWLAARNKSLFGDHCTITCLHPGVCRTDLMKAFNFFNVRPLQALPIFRSAQEGSETILYATISSELDGVSGVYLEDCHITKSSKTSRDIKVQKELWNTTWNLLSKWTGDISAQITLNQTDQPITDNKPSNDHK